MIHSTRNIQELSDTSFNIPNDQIVFGTLDYQDRISKELIDKSPKVYLTKVLNETFNSALSSIYNNSFRDSRINIISGLDISPRTIDTSNRDYIFITINPGLIILDGVSINIDRPIILKFKVPYESVFVNKTYDYLCITAEYLYIDQLPIKFGLFLYDSNTQTVYNDLGESWNSKKFIYRTLKINFDSNIKIFFTACEYAIITIHGREYPSRFYNYYQWMYIRILEDMFSNYYFIDLPYIPPLPKSAVYGITQIFI